MIALFIGRFQPFHAGHLDAINQIKADLAIDQKQGKIIIGIGSSESSRIARNPYNFQERKKMIREAIGKNTKYKIVAVPDINNPPLWVEHVRKTVGHFDVVYTGNRNVKKLFEEKKYTVKILKKNIKISGTEIRRNQKFTLKEKQQKIQKYFNQKEKLTLKNSKYKNQIEFIADFLLKEDLDKIGDITSNILIKKNKIAQAIIFTKEAGIAAGIEEVLWLAKKYGLSVVACKKDGQKIKPGDNLLKLQGKIKDILKTERLLINILGRMCGIATHTQKISSASSPLVCSTRKTILGLMDKKAVSVGGGGTHRLGLYDFILIKENHLKFNSDLHDAIQDIKKKNSFWEIEVENKRELLWAVELNPDVIMLDNFSPQQILNNKKILTKHYNIIWEASGGINIDNIDKYKKTGVDIISLGSLTHSAKNLDISLDIL